MNFGDELGSAFAEMGLQDDLLDEIDQFDVVDFINAKFPDMDCLDSMNEYSKSLNERLQRLDVEIYSAIRLNAEAALHGISEISNLNEAIGDLATRVSSIRDRAEESEKIVKTVSRDIVFLDTAKRNVSLTINTLKKMVMMVNACEQLAELAGSREYAQTSALVCSIRDLELSFDDIKQIPRISELLKHKDRILNDLRLQLIEDYDNRIYLTQSGSLSTTSSRIIPSREDIEKIDFVGAAETVDALGLEVRLEIINKYCLEVMDDYRKNFTFPTGPLAPLSNYEKRFHWLSKALKEYTDKHSSLFPNSWIINGEICMLFCHETRQHFIDLLSHPSSGSMDSTDSAADLMITVLVKCMELENDMQRRFDKLQRSFPSPLSHPLIFKSVISGCFEPYLGQWVTAQDTQFSSLITSVQKAGISADELLGEVGGKSQPPSPRGDPTSRQPSVDDSDPPMVYVSAVNLFAQMRASLQRCRQFTTGPIMVDLFAVFKKAIALYCEKILKTRLPGKQVETTNDGPSSQVLRTVCAVIGSCDYCLKMTPFLHKSCMSFLDQTLDISNEIQSLADMREYAQESGVLVVVREIRAAGIVPISQLDWWSCGSAASVSPHVSKLRGVFDTANQSLKKNLADNHYKAIIDSVTHKIISQLAETVYAAKPISDTGAQQLIVDIAEIKSVLLDSSHKHQQTYIDMVHRGFNRLEVSLKALSSPASGEKQSLRTILSSLDPELGKSTASLDKEVDRLLSLRKPPAPTVAALFTRETDLGISIGRKASSENIDNNHTGMVTKLMSGKLFGSMRK